MEEDRPADQPWLMTINYYSPHPPFDPPQTYLDRYDPAAMPGPLFRESDLNAQEKLADIDFQTKVRRPDEFNAKTVQAAYYAMIEQLDDLLGMLLDSLDRSGQRENTLILFMSDHGETIGDHGLLYKGCRFYEGLVRVPMIWTWPGQIARGVVSNALVELTDIVPTLLDVCELGQPYNMLGRSLWPILTGKVDPDEHREFVRCEYYRALLSEKDGFEGSYATMIRDARFKLVVYHGHGLGELFDLAIDPGEYNNLWDDPAYADVRFQLLLKNFDALAFAVDYGPEQKLYS
jgi:arylsulfatase A-like enzyme